MQDAKLSSTYSAETVQSDVALKLSLWRSLVGANRGSVAEVFV